MWLDLKLTLPSANHKNMQTLIHLMILILCSNVHSTAVMILLYLQAYWGSRQLRFNCSHRRPVYAFFITTCNKTHSSYQVKLQKEVKSTQKQPNCKKSAAHAKKDSIKKSCEIKGGGPEVTIQVNLVPIPWRRQHKFAWIVDINNFAIILTSQPLLGRHLWFHNFFHAVFFCMGCTFFYSLTVFV